MAFEGEYAKYEPLRRILESESVRNLEKRMKTLSPEHKTNIPKGLLKRFSQNSTNFDVDMILAIDGGYQCAPIQTGFPGSEIGYITIASVLMLMKDLRNLAEKEFIDPIKYRETEKTASFESVFPGANVVVDNDIDPKVSLRKMIYEQFQATTAFSDFESLLDTYEALLSLRLKEGITSLPKSPFEDTIDDTANTMEIQLGEYNCKDTGQTLYSTDALRIHELMKASGTNGEMYGQLMMVIERLWLVHLLRAFEKKQWLSVLKNTAFVLDGSLAVFSVSAWISKFILQEIRRINELQKEINGTDLIIVGLEKSGRFVEHFNDMDVSADGVEGEFPEQTALLLNDDYIKNNIIYSQSEKPYGDITYFGRKFFYKTENGYRLVPQLVCYTEDQKNILTAKSEQFPRLNDVCCLLDSLISCSFPNSITPLISAHAEAAIPLSLGKKIFEEIALEIRNRSFLK